MHVPLLGMPVSTYKFSNLKPIAKYKLWLNEIIGG